MAQNGCTTRLVINLTPSQKKCGIEPPNMASALKTGNKFCFWLFLDPKMMENDGNIYGNDKSTFAIQSNCQIEITD